MHLYSCFTFGTVSVNVLERGDVSFVFIFGFCYGRVFEFGTAAAGGEYDSQANDDVCKGNFDGKKVKCKTE